MGLKKRAVAWVKGDLLGVEFAEIDLGMNDLSARGVAIAGGPVSYRLDYTLQTAADFVTLRLHGVSRGQGWRRAIELLRDGQGIWTLGPRRKVLSICPRLAAILPGSPTRWIATSVSLP